MTTTPEPEGAGTSSATPRRIRVVGNSGAGKTTFARAVAARLGVPHLELDAVFWDAGWTHRDLTDAHRRLTAFTSGDGADGWSVDGNWNSKLDGLLDDADAVVWLDFPRYVVMPRVIWRSLQRGVTRRELWHGNRERLSNLLRRDPEENIVRWAWTQHDAYRAQYTALAAADPRVVHLRTPRDAHRWLRDLG